MKKKKNAAPRTRLEIRREVLRHLAPEQLAKVTGGGDPRTLTDEYVLGGCRASQ